MGSDRTRETIQIRSLPPHRERRTLVVPNVERERRFDLFSLGGRVAVVTGAGRGIGAAICHRLTECGAYVVAVDIDAAAAESVAQRLGARVTGIRADVANEADVRAASAAAIERFGHLDIWVNSAGIYPCQDFPQMSLDDWRHVTQVDL
jgi:NAD(P)-dependent dehydrogenase (short-subunit alcohol dehydrogenase family)